MVHAAADWLLRDRELLPWTLVIVPTGHSARRLRQALARRGGGSVFAPRMQTPDGLFRPVEGSCVASEAMLRAAWHEALLSAPPEETDALRPAENEEFVPDRAWTSGWSDLILPTLDALGEVGIRAEEVPARCPAIGPDARKWETIGHLARRVEARLSGLGRMTPAAAKRLRAGQASAIPAGTRRIVLAGVPDPVPLACIALERWMELSGVPVDVLVHAPADMEGIFDVWGRPEREGWKVATLPLPGGNDAIQIVRDDEDLARSAVLTCRDRMSQEIALGCPDDSLLPSLERAFSAAGWPLYNPGGRSVGSTGLLPALSFWLDLLGSSPAPYSAVSGFLRTAAAWDWLRAAGLQVQPFRLATTLDLLAVDFLPETLDDALNATKHWEQSQEYPGRHRRDMLEMKELEAIFMTLTESVNSGRNLGLAAVTKEFFDRLAAQGHDDGADGQAVERLAEAVGDLGELQVAFPDLAATDRAALWRATLPEIVRVEDDPKRVLDIHGWLELPYESGPHLVVAGMVEGKVPDAPQDHALLPDSVRRSLGLRDRESRTTRDAFLWRSLVGSRESSGSVTVLVPKFDGRGEPRRPSSLLFRCLPPELPGRVAHCFRELDEPRVPRAPIGRGAWLLDFTSSAEKAKPIADGSILSVSPTKLRDYLECPFRYYLRYLLGMEQIEANPRQWNPRKFGTVLHEVLCEFGQNLEIRDSTRGEHIQEFLMKSLDKWLDINHGDGLSLPLDVQIASARERLRGFAAAQADERAAGWEIREVEWKVGRGEQEWLLGGARVSMTLDRVDYHPGQGAWRVLDYKTGAVKSVEDEHLESHLDWKLTLGDLVPKTGRQRSDRRWRNVQLPLYAAFLRQSGADGLRVEPDQTIETGYVLLPRATSEIKFSLWERYDAALEASALSWATEAVRRLQAGIYGPPIVAPNKPLPEPWVSIAADGWEKALAQPLPVGFAGEGVSA